MTSPTVKSNTILLHIIKQSVAKILNKIPLHVAEIRVNGMSFF